MESDGTFRPMIDHSILSPCGRVSKRQREETNRRLYFELGIDKIEAEMRALPLQAAERERKLRWAAELRALAARGFRTKYHIRQAERLEAEAAAL